MMPTAGVGQFMYHNHGLTRRRARELAPIELIRRHFTGPWKIINKPTDFTAVFFIGTPDTLCLSGFIANNSSIAPAEVQHAGLQTIILDTIRNSLAILNGGHIAAIR